MNRKQKEYEERKKKIMKIAKNLFIEKGFSNVSLNEVAKKADFGKATLYHYFKSKNELLYLIIREYDLKRVKSCFKMAKKGQNSYEIIYNNYWEFYSYVKKDPEIFFLTHKNNHLLYNEIIPNLSVELKEKYENYINEVGNFLKQTLKDGEAEGLFKTMPDKDFQLGYLSITSRSILYFIFHNLFVTKTLTEAEADNYFKLHLEMILNNI